MTAAAVWNLWPEGMGVKFFPVDSSASQTLPPLLSCQVSLEKLTEVLHFNKLQIFSCDLVS